MKIELFDKRVKMEVWILDERDMWVCNFNFLTISIPINMRPRFIEEFFQIAIALSMLLLTIMLWYNFSKNP